MDAIEALEKLAADPELGERLTRLEVAPARPARYGDPERPLHPEVLERLAARGAERLYVHQAEAIDRLRAGRSVALATGTGSGKSLCYQAPIAESICDTAAAAESVVSAQSVPLLRAFTSASSSV